MVYSQLKMHENSNGGVNAHYLDKEGMYASFEWSGKLASSFKPKWFYAFYLLKEIVTEESTLISDFVNYQSLTISSNSLCFSIISNFFLKISVPKY